MDSWIQILVTVVTVLGSGAAFQFYTNKMKLRAEERKDEMVNSDTHLYRDDLKNRVRNMEELLARSADEKDELRQRILDLTAEVHSLRVKVDFLERENQALKMRK
jgi:predicted nuclease with TOPRIM domain